MSSSLDPEQVCGSKVIGELHWPTFPVAAFGGFDPLVLPLNFSSDEYSSLSIVQDILTKVPWVIVTLEGLIHVHSKVGGTSTLEVKVFGTPCCLDPVEVNVPIISYLS